MAWEHDREFVISTMLEIKSDVKELRKTQTIDEAQTAVLSSRVAVIEERTAKRHWVLPSLIGVLVAIGGALAWLLTVVSSNP